MEALSRTFALHGALVLLVGMAAGVILHAAIRRGSSEAGWHLSHAGISGRGVMLLALAGIGSRIELPPGQQLWLAWLLLFFVWSSTAAMVFGAVMGVRGQRWESPWANRAMYATYVVGGVAVFPAMALLIRGLW